MIAVEPLAEMRAVLERVVPDVETLDGAAERIPLEDALADVVTVAAAFHWFRHDQALPEIHRVLRPGGRLALLWNERDLTQPLQRAFEDILQRHVGALAQGVNLEWREPIERSQLFDPAGEAKFPLEQEFDADLLVERARSISFVAVLPEPTRTEALDEIRALADELPERFPFRYTTKVYAWTRR